jgi:hypothetical protein
MIQCVKKYLQNGLMDYDKISLPIKKLQTEINIELYNQLQHLNLTSITFTKSYLIITIQV